ncbi:heparan sulfate 2-O-sulfotransferase pipe-like isoform X2 [Anastrepha ludens]|uniref:heparan sulfate 2-O-sulfotransferase pipe-like isoform X2 n=1 Tax=Anastrepha ludens TaxID=28586 RepID=UPI0023B01C39|nr:heparan sulfate 2-O-sulfotransferase pipe-like isoform X2 [Anastrepha ludens]
MNLGGDKSFKMKMRDVENAFKYRRIPYPKRSVELIAILAISCTFFLFMHTNKLNSRLKEMEIKLQPSEFSALGLTGNHINSRESSRRDNINTLHGTYQYLKSTGQLPYLTPESVNTTKKAEIDIVLFNRVPKVGSQTLMGLLKFLAKRNGFEARRDKPSLMETIMLTPNFELSLVDEIMEEGDATSYSKHVAFIDFGRLDMPWPIYINLVRHPVERLISWFYYVRAPWYIVERKKNFPKEYRVPNIAWLKKSFDSCILKHDAECIFAQGDKKGLGDHRRQMLFFCGQNNELCMPFNSYQAMQQAKRNVENHYAVIGTWEETNITLTVLEHYIPRFFAGATETYYKAENNLHQVNRNSIKPSVSQEVREILHKNLTNEIEFYNFCKQRLYKQYIAIKLKKY